MNGVRSRVVLGRVLVLLLIVALQPVFQRGWVQAAESATDEGQTLQTPQRLDLIRRNLPGEQRRTIATTLGDVNGDGLIDIVQAYYEQPLRVFLGKGAGFFQDPIDLPLETNMDSEIKLGDIDGDNKLDMIIQPTDQPPSIFFGLGNGFFGPRKYAFADIDYAFDIDLGDLNGDGFLDIFINNHIFANDGKGNFTQPHTEFCPMYCKKELLDINNDKKMDIVVINATAPTIGVLETFLGEGDGRFIKIETLDITGLTFATGDFNNDGIIDVITGITYYMQGESSQLLLGIGDGSFRDPIYLSYEFQITNSVYTGDIDGDGILDIVYHEHENLTRVSFGTGNGNFTKPANIVKSVDFIHDIDIEDINADGALDIVISGFSGSYILINHQQSSFASPISIGQFDGFDIFGLESHTIDINADGMLDIITNGSVQFFLGTSSGRFTSPERKIAGIEGASDIGIGDFNEDGWNDILIGFPGGKPGKIVTGLANGIFNEPKDIQQDSVHTVYIAVGDVNDDEKLDAVFVNSEGPSQIFIGDGKGSFNIKNIPDIECDVSEVEIVNMDQDGISDIFFGCPTGENFFISGDTLNNLKDVTIIKNPNGSIVDIELAYINEDNFIDAVLAVNSMLVRSEISYVALGNRDGTFQSNTALPGKPEQPNRVRMADFNQDGANDLVMTGQDTRVFFGRGDGSFDEPVTIATNDISTSIIDVGDVDGDGVLDIILMVGVDSPRIQLVRGLRNKHFAYSGEPSPTLKGAATTTTTASNQHPPVVRLFRPDALAEASELHSPIILSTPVVTIPYQLSDPEGNRVRAVHGFYSLDGGGTWHTAVATNTTTFDLAAEPSGSNHIFRWDVAVDALTGQYNNVLFRIVAVPPAQQLPKHPAEQRRVLAPSGTSTPFRLRGSQARVVNTTGSGLPGAKVYRLDAQQVRDGQLIPAPANGNPQWYTDWQGYLKGHDSLTMTERLVALAPISATDTYTLYHTSASPTLDGFDFHTIRSSGVQTLTVSPDNPLILFNLDLSVEWDARGDSVFRTQLEAQIKRASELLFRWSNGQVALGDIRIFSNGERWNDAHIRLYATNRMRPSAAQGGIVWADRADPDKPDLVYERGQLRMGAVWNRYGEASAELGEEWARTLAHELGHYALFLNDNYLLKQGDRLITSDICPGPMTDPYDDSEGSFRPQADWLPACASTLSQIENGRADWTTINTFYTTSDFTLNEPPQFAPEQNPSVLPLAVTQVRFDTAFASTADLPIAGPLVLLSDDQGRPLRLGGRARGILYQGAGVDKVDLPTGARVIDLGSPVEERLAARGARRGDTVCVYTVDTARDQQRQGCVAIRSNNQQLRLAEATGWRPVVQARPVSPTELALAVQGVTLKDGETLRAQLYPSDRRALPSFDLQPTGSPGVFEGTLSDSDGGMFEGVLRVWATGTPRRETLIDLRMYGNPSGMWYRGTPRGSPSGMWYRGAPALSADGQAILYTGENDLAPGTLYLLQATDSPPAPPVWAAPVSRAYRLTTTDDAALAGGSLNIGYLSQDVPSGQEPGVHMFVWDETMRVWTVLDTYLDRERNQASAPVSSEGLYMLMATTQVPLGSQGWNLVAFYPGATQAIGEAVATIAGGFSLIAGFNSEATEPWRIYDSAVPPAWATLVNDLEQLRTSERYWIYATEPISWFVRGPGGQSTQRSILNSLPPAVFYGHAPAAGLTVEALVDGASCGTATTEARVLDGTPQAVFVVKVRAVGDENTNCGVAGRPVALVFRDGTRIVQRLGAVWDNTRAQGIGVNRLFVPQVRR